MSATGMICSCVSPSRFVDRTIYSPFFASANWYGSSCSAKTCFSLIDFLEESSSSDTFAVSVASELVYTRYALPSSSFSPSAGSFPALSVIFTVPSGQESFLSVPFSSNQLTCSVSLVSSPAASRTRIWYVPFLLIESSDFASRFPVLDTRSAVFPSIVAAWIPVLSANHTGNRIVLPVFTVPAFGILFPYRINDFAVSLFFSISSWRFLSESSPRGP